MIVLKPQFNSKYLVNNLAARTSLQAKPFDSKIFIGEIEILKKKFLRVKQNIPYTMIFSSSNYALEV